MALIMTLVGAVQAPAQDRLSRDSAITATCNSTDNKATSFVWPVKGKSLDGFIGPISPSQLTTEPKSDGWYVWNGVGHDCPSCIGSQTYIFHPGSDLNRNDGQDGNAPVYAPANGVVTRVVSAGDNGYYLMISSCLTSNVDWSKFVLPGTTPTQALTTQDTNMVTFNFIHVVNLEPGVEQFGHVVHVGQKIAEISPTRGHLHFETIQGFQNSTAASNNSDGYYAAQQDITDFNTLMESGVMARLVNMTSQITAPSGLLSDFNSSLSDYSAQQGWSTSGLWHVTNRKKVGTTGNSWRYAREGNADYNPNSQPTGGALMSPSFTYQRGEGLSFKTWFQTEPTSTSRVAGTVDRKRVWLQDLRTSLGTGIRELTEIQDYDSATIIGNDNGWVENWVSLPEDLAGKPVRIWFVFNTSDNQFNNYEGWYVDDVKTIQIYCPAGQQSQSFLQAFDLKKRTAGFKPLAFSEFATTQTLSCGGSSPSELYSTSFYSDPSLVAYYRLESGGSDSKGSYSLSNNGATFVPAQFGNGASTGSNNSSQRLTITNNLGLTAANDFSMSIWVKPNQQITSGSWSLFDHRDAAYSSYISIWYDYNGGTPRLVFLKAINGINAINNYYTYTLPTNAFTHLVLTYQANTGIVTGYVNGTQVTQGSYSSNAGGSGVTDSLTIGSTGNGYLYSSAVFDDAAVFSRVLTATDVANLYGGGGGSSTGTVSVAVSGYSSSISCALNSANITAPTTLTNQATGSYTLSCTPPTGYSIISVTPSATQTLSSGGTATFTVTLTTTPSGPTELFSSSLFSDSSLVAYYRLESDGADSKGSYTLANNNGVTFTAAKFGNGASAGTSNTNKRLYLANNLGLNVTHDTTLNIWVKPLQAISSGQQWSMFDLRDATYSSYLSIWYDYTGSSPAIVFMKAINGIGATTNNAYTYTLPTSQLTMLTLVLQASTGTVTGYVNGVQVITSTYANNSGGSGVTSSISIGSTGNGYLYSSALFDDAAVFSRMLTSTEISSLYSGGGSSGTGTVGVTVSGYSGNISCTLNGSAITAPITLNNKPTGSYTLSCTAPSGYTVSSITPSATQTLSGGGTVSFAVALSSSSGPTELYGTSFYSDSALKMYFRLEDTSDSKGSYTLTNQNGATFTAAKFGNGAEMGSGNSSKRLIVNNNPGLTAASDLTMSIWVKPDVQPSGQWSLFDLRDTTYQSYISIWYQYNAGVYQLVFLKAINGAGGTTHTYTYTLPTTSFTHLVLTYQGSTGTVTGYANGVQLGQESYSNNSGGGGIANNSVSIGSTGNGYLYASAAFDDAAIFSRALTSTEVSTLYGGGSQQTTGTVSVTVSGYSGSIGCTLNGNNITIPTTLSSQQPGNYTLAYCNAPSGYTLSISPAATQTLSAGSTVTFAVTATATTTLSVQNCTASPSTVWPGQGGEVGQGIVFSVPTPTGGATPYNYSWTGSFSSSLQSQAIYPSQFGTTYTGYLTVTDSGTGGNQQSRQTSCSAQTYAATTAPQNVSMTISPSNPAAGQVVTITLTGLGFYSNTQVQLFGGLCGSNGCTASNVANSVSISGMQALAQLNNAATFTVWVGNIGGMLSQVGSFTVH